MTSSSYSELNIKERYFELIKSLASLWPTQTKRLLNNLPSNLGKQIMRCVWHKYESSCVGKTNYVISCKKCFVENIVPHLEMGLSTHFQLILN